MYVIRSDSPKIFKKDIIPVHTKTNVDLSDDLYYYCTTCERSEYII